MQTSDLGLVSVIMPTFNCAQYIGEAIECVMKQTYENWEIIIEDDCSTDNTQEVVEQFKDKRIKYYRLSENRGAAVARNCALSKACGRWIAFLDSDDLWNRTKLQQQLEFMESNGYSFSYTNYDLIDQNGSSLNRVISGPTNVSRLGMLCYCWPGCLTVIYDKEAVGDIQISDIKKNNDYAMWLLISRKAHCHLYDNTLASYRIRKGSISRVSYIKLIKWHYRLFKMVENMNPLTASFWTSVNILCGLIKKVIYQKHQVAK